MYQVVGIKNLIVAFAVVAAIVTAWRLEVAPPTTLWGYWPPISLGLTVSTALILGLGQSPLFPLFCRIPGLRGFAPDISGDWRATLDSNWPLIAGMAGLPVPASGTVTAKVRVKARLLRVTVNLDADSQYSNSKTVSVSAGRDEDTGDIKLYYVYANHTPNPEATDSSHHYGSAFLDFVGHGRAMVGTGLYWSNRNWTKGLNTAGKIRWERPVPVDRSLLSLLTFDLVK